MYSVLLLATASLLACLLITPLVKRVSHRFGIVDQPDSVRKLHACPVPRTGGVALVLSGLIAFAVLLVSPLHAGALVQAQLPAIAALMPAAAIVFVTGLLDDLIGLEPWQKLIGQLAAAILANFAGVRMLGALNTDFWHWCSLPLTIAWLVLCTNAFNLIDGIDGLAAGAGLMAASTMLIAAIMQGNSLLALATAPLAGSLIGILYFNLSPASIFLGDCGSLTIGFLLGCYGLIWSEKSTTILGMTAPIIALGLPLLDTGLAMVRRFLLLRPIFGADRAHIHHRLLDQGLTPRRVTLVLYVVCGTAAALSLLASAKHGQFSGLVVVVFCAAIWGGIHRLRYVEFDLARKLFVQRFRRILESELCILDFDAAMASANTPDECWQAMVQISKSFGLAGLELRLGNRTYSETLKAVEPSACWHLRVPLSDSDYVNFVRAVRPDGQPSDAVPYLDVVIRSAKSRLAKFQHQGSEPDGELYAEVSAP